jgi:thioredoxin-related protein
MQKTYLLFTILILISNLIKAQKTFSFEDISVLQKKESRNIVIFVETDWCTYCKQMKATTFKNKEIHQILNEKFYFIKLNAEEKKSIRFNGETYNFQPTGFKTGIHELALKFNSKNQNSYPILIILNPQNEILLQYNGFLNKNELQKLLESTLTVNK